MNFNPALNHSEQFETLLSALRKKEGKAAVFGLHPIHRALYAAALAKALNKTVLMICESDADAVIAAEDCCEMGARALAFPSRDYVFLDVQGISHDTELQRLAVLGAVQAGGVEVLCASAEACCQYTMPRAVFAADSFSVRRGESIKIQMFVEKLIAAGYTRTDRVEGAGQFTVRGGILDIFPAQAENPVRLELFGDVIDQLASFDSESQRRIEQIKETVIVPAREVPLGGKEAALEQYFARCEKKAPQLGEIVARDLQQLRDGITPGCTDRYLNVVYDHPETLLDHLPGGVLFFCDPSAIQKRLKNLIQMHTEELLSLEGQGMYLKNSGSFYRDRIETAGHAAVYADTFARTLEVPSLDALINVRANVIPRWSGEMQLLIDDVREYLATGYACVVLAATPRAAAAIASDLADAGIPAALLNNTVPEPGTAGVAVGQLSSGFELQAVRLAVIAGRRDAKPQQRRYRGRRHSAGRAITSLEDLRPGDYVVHQNHGIGLYDGIHRIDHHGLVRDYIKIKYQGADTLYVPVTQLDMVSQYISPKSDESVKLAKLHSGEWNKTKQSVYRSVREMAKELIELYARRSKVDGIAFSPDTEWQNSFEARFAYDETDDQLRAIDEIKRDMQRPQPMDRLLCGDVGVGKTEVALRAVFKAVCDGYQCAVLVPTTILAWQHYHTFLERLEAYPVKVAMLSRFATSKEIKKAVEGIRNGTVDIAIGTHRLLQKDIQFKKLGLLVVDEEQRFGVGHKEKLKELFAGVDVLTLSATPIPRTLNMAMSGIRDMSVIEEPPLDRHPVQTYVLEYDTGVVVDAIKRELSRGGQVYYLHNRVESIEHTAYTLSQLLPDARIEVAHGQMNEETLSDVWRRLIGGEIDILVCTTIIETGVDVPNCNTLIVENADAMGLSQLYQLRGRVGRSGRRAFAYFTFRRDRMVSDVAAKRLAAIRDFTSFGSGFKIAMRDLQIRGAGGVLSARQSGHMAAVGYDTYLRILEQAVSDETGAVHYEKPVSCTVDLAVSAYIPNEYIADDESRIEMYKQIAAVDSDADAADVLDELQDRFGDVPETVQTLVDISRIRVAAGKLRFYEVTSQKGGGSGLIFYGDDIDADRVSGYIRQKTRRVLYSAKGKSHLLIEVRPDERVTEVALEALRAMRC